MSNVSIYEKNWTDLVFENRNKEYGAYQLRQESQKTTLLAFFLGVLFFLTLIGSWMLLSSFGSKIEDVVDDTPTDKIVVVDLDRTPPPAQPLAQKQPITQALPEIEPINTSRMVVAATPEATVNVPTNENLVTQTNIGATTGTSIDVPPGDGSPTGTAVASSGSGEVIRTSVELDRLPEYPGGIKKFYEYVGSSIERSEFESTVSVIMSFVIEKDGSMSNIRCVRSSDKNLEREAIRVLKALKIKWAPGYLNNEKVRTQYSLPIKVTI